MQMPDVHENPLRVGIVARSSRHRKALTTILVENSLDVVDEEIMQEHLPDRISLNVADVLLVNLDDTDEPSIDVLINETSLPILFNDGASIRKPTTVSGKAWGKRLASKLVELVQSSPAISEPPGKYIVDANSSSQELKEELPVDTSPDLHLVESGSELEFDISIDELMLEEAVSNSATELDQNDEIVEIPVDIDAQSGGISLEFENLGMKLEHPDATVSENINPYEVMESQRAEEVTYDGGMDFDPGPIDEPNSLDLDVSALEIEQPNETLEIVIHEELKPVKAAVDKPEKEVEQIWVLGASIGGPEAVKRFLAALPENMPVAFVLAQHIGSGFVKLLAEQLGRVSRLDMIDSEDGVLLQDNQLLVAPVENRLAFDDNGRVMLKEVHKHSIYSPSIDDVMLEVAKRYSGKANAIIFSGMGNDGTVGCQAIAENGGLVWAQTGDTCVISSMSDSARNTGNVTYSASPEDLANNLLEHLGMS